jgi:hypothetical protein
VQALGRLRIHAWNPCRRLFIIPADDWVSKRTLGASTMTIAAKNLTPTVTTGPLPASRKIHIPGDIHPDIRVPMREISLHPTSGEPPVVVYDSSGPYTMTAPIS